MIRLRYWLWFRLRRDARRAGRAASRHVHRSRLEDGRRNDLGFTKVRFFSLSQARAGGGHRGESQRRQGEERGQHHVSPLKQCSQTV